jgi:hypothetical protein
MVLPVMNVLLGLLLWCVLLVLCWPLAILAVVALPVMWLLALPFRLLYAAVEALLSFVRAVLFLPARLLGSGPRG